jgi:hypothetical protein
VYLYRVPGANPLAWVATGSVKADSLQTFAAVLNERFDPSRAAIFDEASTVAVTPPPAVGYTPPTVSVTAYAPGRIDLALSAPAPAGSALVVSENYFPGWTATAAGKPLPVARANFNLIGAVLPEGATTVQLRFADPAFATGKTVSLVSTVLALILVAVGVVMDRRRSAPTELPAGA